MKFIRLQGGTQSNNKNDFPNMAVIRYTHGYDLLYRVSVGVGGLVVAGYGFDLASLIVDPIQEYIPAQGPEWLVTILGIAFLVSGYACCLALLTKTILPPWLPSYMYGRYTLGTKLSSKDAAGVSLLFEGSLTGGIWYPCRFVTKLDPEFRLEALTSLANRVAAEHGFVPPFPQAAPPPERKTQGKKSDFAANGGKGTSPSGTSSGSWQRENDGPRREDGSDYTHKAAPPPQETVSERQVKESLKVLGLSGSPDFVAIKQAYRRKISQYHPDRFAGEGPEVMKYGEEMAKRINGAYSFLQARYEVADA